MDMGRITFGPLHSKPVQVGLDPNQKVVVEALQRVGMMEPVKKAPFVIAEELYMFMREATRLAGQPTPPLWAHLPVWQKKMLEILASKLNENHGN